MSENSNYLVILSGKICGIILIIISAIMLYYTATAEALGTFNTIFIVPGVAILIIGILLLIITPKD
ncbi:MAG: hypothetical protein LBE76_00750 [Nitrososphaerota archaeon]|jgi:hypothetical protein|nr:hypothetical protein [Nitrososphaerota archaeon]